MRRLLALTIAIFLFAAACGDSDDDTDVDGTTTSASVSSQVPESTTSVSATTQVPPTTTSAPATTMTTSGPAKSCSQEGTKVVNGEACLELVVEANFSSYTDFDDVNVQNWRMPPPLPDGFGMCPVLSGPGVPYFGSVSYLQVFLIPGENGKPVETRTFDYGLPDDEQPAADDFYKAVSDLALSTSSTVSFDLVLHPAMRFGFGTGDDPTPVNASELPFENASGGKGASIIVLDTGLPAGGTNTWPKNIEIPGQGLKPAPTSLKADPTYGHGLMVAGVAAGVASEATVAVVDATVTLNGAKGPVDVITVAALTSLVASFDEFQADESALNMSFGTYGCSFDEDIRDDPLLEDLSVEVLLGLENVEPILALELAIEGISGALGQDYTVAAAGNDASDVPFYPAAFENVIGVGAIDTTRPNTTACVDNTDGRYVWSPPDASGKCALQSDFGEPNAGAEFSNFGAGNVMSDGMVVVAPGTDMVVEYPNAPDLTKEYFKKTEALLTTRVRVSGTSLAAPYVAACLVAPQSVPCAGLSDVIDQLRG